MADTAAHRPDEFSESGHINRSEQMLPWYNSRIHRMGGRDTEIRSSTDTFWNRFVLFPEFILGRAHPVRFSEAAVSAHCALARVHRSLCFARALPRTPPPAGCKFDLCGPLGSGHSSQIKPAPHQHRQWRTVMTWQLHHCIQGASQKLQVRRGEALPHAPL